MKKFLIINGPNLNLLHLRNKAIYGDSSLEKITADCLELANQIDIEVDFLQSNNEAQIIDSIQHAIDKFDGIIINAGAYSHTSIAIRDALEIYQGKKIELHISNIYKREDFRHHSMLSGVVDGVICGVGTQGYTIALLAINNMTN